MTDCREHRNTQLESVLGTNPRGFESPILRHEIGAVTCGDTGDGPFECVGMDGVLQNERLQLQKAFRVLSLRAEEQARVNAWIW